MSVMQVAHGGDKGGSFKTAEFLPQLGNGMDNMHVVGLFKG